MKTSSFLGPSITANYRPGLVGASSRSYDHRGVLTWGDIEAMKRDPQVAFGLRILYAPLPQVKWKVKAKDPAVAKYVDRTLKRLWTNHLHDLLDFVCYGHSGGEVIWKHDEQTDTIEFDRLDPVMPPDLRPLQIGRDLAGITVQGVDQGDGGPGWIRPPRSLWAIHEQTPGTLYGRSRLRAVWIPWQEKTARHGALDVRRLWFVKNVFRGGIIRHPAGTIETAPGVFSSCQDYARELVEKMEAGGVLTLPNLPDDHGNQLWTYEEPKVNGDLTGVREYTGDLDTEILTALGIPPEVVKAADTGSGWSGRSVPFLVWLSSEDIIAASIIKAAVEQICRPGVAVNYGEQWFEVEPVSLVPKQMTEDAAQTEGEDGDQGDDQTPPDTQPPAPPPAAPPAPPPVAMSLDTAPVQLAQDPAQPQADPWQAYVGKMGKRKGQSGWKNSVTGRVVWGDKPTPKKATAQEAKPAHARPAVGDVAARIKALRESGRATPEQVQEVADQLMSLTVRDIQTIKRDEGVKGGKVKAELVAKVREYVAARAAEQVKNVKPDAPGLDNKNPRLDRQDAAGKNASKNPTNLEKQDERQRGRDGAGGEGVRSADAGDGRPVAAETGRPDATIADQGRNGGNQSPDPAAVGRVPAGLEEVNKRINRFESFFRNKGQQHVADWLGQLRSHVNAMGPELALASLNPSSEGRKGDGSEVQYWGVGTEEANWKNMGSFMESYLARNGIIAVTGDASDPNLPLISALGAPDKYVAGDFKPAGMHYTDKLTEAKDLPGLETSEDISKIMGKPVTHLTQEVTDKLDERYGKGQWIVKCYDDNAAAGYGIFFPQRAAAIAQDARSTIWNAGSALAQYGFRLARDPDTRKVVGLVHETGDTYAFGSEEYQGTIGGEARQWADRAAAAAQSEQGALLPEGSFMAQPAFKALGISDEERAAGKTWHEKNEGRVHLVTREDGNVEVIPHSTWLKGGSLPVVFEDEDTKAMAEAARAAIAALPPEARKGQVYAPDIMKTAEGYRVVELNAQGDSNGSGYLHDNHFTIDAYTSHLAGRAPAHVAFIRQLLTSRKSEAKRG